MTLKFTCFECGQAITAPGLSELGDVYVAHARVVHDWPYAEQGIRNYAEATQRLTGPSERLDTHGEPIIHPVTEDRIDDWVAFFDHDAFVGVPEWASCYCLAPHPRGYPVEDPPRWSVSRQRMVNRLAEGDTCGYLAYVDGRVAGWVNASKVSQYTESFRHEDDPEPKDIIGVTCFIIAPPYRRHGVAAALLDRVIADAPKRRAGWVQAYPYNDSGDHDTRNYRGPRAIYEARGFEIIEVRDRDTIVRLEVGYT